MVPIKPQIIEHLTTWSERSSCSPYCKRSRQRVCSGDFECYDDGVLCTGLGWNMIWKFYFQNSISKFHFIKNCLIKTAVVTRFVRFKQPVIKEIVANFNTNLASMARDASTIYMTIDWWVVTIWNFVMMIQFQLIWNFEGVVPRAMYGHGCTKSEVILLRVITFVLLI